jgi:hypothetical protein
MFLSNSKAKEFAPSKKILRRHEHSEYSRWEYQKNHIFCGFLLFLGQKSGIFGIILNYSTISTHRQKLRDTHNQVSIPIFYS